MARYRQKKSSGNSSKTKGNNGNPRNQKKGSGYTGKQNETTSEDSKQGEPAPDEETKPTKTNDAEWYMKDPATMNAAAKIPFSNPFGAPIDLIENRERFSPDVGDTPHLFAADAMSRNTSVAGVCTLNVAPSWGDNVNKNDPLNVCANALYAEIRHVNNGRKNYDPADVLKYALVFGEIYSFIIWLSRVYNYAYMYSQRNYFIARDLLVANHVNPENIRENLANFRYFINSYINKVSSFAVPSDIYYFRRRVFMFANVYLENPYGNIKDQLYQFAPTAFGMFSIDADTSKGVITPESLYTGDTLLTMSDLITYANKFLENVSGDEDFGLMSGDILKTFQSNIIGLPPIGEEGGILPVYDAYVLSQFKNAQMVTPDFSSKYKVTPTQTEEFKSGCVYEDDSGNLVTRTFIQDNRWKSQLLATTAKIITVENPEPDVGDVVEATRLMVCAKGFQQLDAQPSGSEMKTYIACGSELVVSVTITRHDANNATIQHTFEESVLDENADTFNSLRALEYLGQFKYCPLFYVADASGNEVTRFVLVSNIDNYAIAGNDQIGRIHEAALLSLFYVPGVAKLVS